MNTLSHRFFRWLLGAGLLLSLTACGLELPFILGAAGIGVGTKVAVDRRTAADQLADVNIESKAKALIGRQSPEAHVNVNSINRVVLLTGEVANQKEKQSIEAGVNALTEVRSVFNHLEIAPPSALSARAGDTWTTSKIKTRFAADPSINGKDISVVTEAGVVYLMGLLTAEEAQRARQSVANEVGGIVRVVSLFEIIPAKSQ